MTLWRNERTGTIYDHRYSSPAGDRFVWMRSARKRKLTRVLEDHIVEHTPDSALAWDDELLDPYAGEPEESAADVAELGAAELAVAPAEPVDRGGPGFDDFEAPSLPAIHEALRVQSYNVGSVMAMLAEIQPHWPATSIVNTLNVAVLLLGDEITRVKDARRV